MMKTSQIKEGRVYKGLGAVYLREVEIMWVGSDGRDVLHWHTPNTLPVRTPSGRTMHTPNGTCLVSTFARWAQRRMKNWEE